MPPGFARAGVGLPATAPKTPLIPTTPPPPAPPGPTSRPPGPRPPRSASRSRGSGRGAYPFQIAGCPPPNLRNLLGHLRRVPTRAEAVVKRVQRPHVGGRGLEIKNARGLP